MPKKIKKQEQKTDFFKGLGIGVGSALLITIIVLLIIFSPQIKGLFDKEKQPQSNDDSPAKLRVTVIGKNDCDNCFDINLFLEALRQNDVEITATESIDYSSSEAKQLVSEYEIGKLPTLLISGDLNKNEQLAAAWPSLGRIVDGVFVFDQVLPPYYDIESGEVKGELQITYLTVDECSDCYDVSLHQSALANLGISGQEEKTVDVSSEQGQEIVEKYGIVAAPTVLIGGEVDVYTSLSQIWEAYGNVADDGTYVFTNTEAMGNYYDLQQNKMIEASIEEADNNQLITQ